MKVVKNQLKKQSFKRILLNRCQTEFENKPKPPEYENITNHEERSELEMKTIKIRQRILGNIRFICELFKKKDVN